MSAWGRWFMEKQRVQYHYNIKYKQLRAYMMRAFMRGIDYPGDHLVQELESRLDNVIWRVGIAPTMVAAQKFIFCGHVQYRLPGMNGWRTINHASAHCQVNMEFRVRPTKGSLKLVKEWTDSIGPVELPSHLIWDPETLTGTYSMCARLPSLAFR